MRKIFVAALTVLSVVFNLNATELSDSTLRRYAAEMLMVGFKGDTITADNPVVGYLKDLKVGGIILFDIDLTGSRKLGSRNITTAPRLRALTADIQRLADYPVLIAADQEGGLVQRLKPRYGFTSIPSARHIGLLADLDSTRRYAALMADELAWAGVNVNLAPELDIHRDDCPVIGKLDRAYSADPDSVALHASATVDEHHARGVLCAVKHFPGHGSATSDSHYGLTDVTATWSEDELRPFATLFADGKADMVMTAHIFNRQLDPALPATLSHAVLTGLLRDRLGFDGIILTDDMYMQGIIDNYDIAEAVVLAINAGADMLVMGNNISTGFEADRPARIIDIIVEAVRDGRIPAERLTDAHRRIAAARERLPAK